MKNFLTVGVLALTIGCVDAFSADVETEENGKSAVRSTGDAYVRAFNSRNTKALAAFWSPDAVYLNRLTGEQVIGREAIANQFETLFKSAQDLQLKVQVKSIDFVSPNVAVELGVATFLSANTEPDSVDYSAVYIRQQDKWLLDRVTDDPKPVVQSHYEQLKDLEWMVGSWSDEGEAGQVATTCNWSKNKNFLTRSFAVSIGDRIDLSGIQFIGWDAAEKQIRSWTFDSDGGFSQGRWSKDDNRWYIRKQGTTADGSKVTAVNIVTHVDDDTFTLQATQRTFAGDLLPNVEEVVVIRK